MVLKLRVTRAGRHVHVAHFTGFDRDHLQRSGEIVLGSIGDWQEYGAVLTHGCNELHLASGHPLVDLIVDDAGLDNTKGEESS